MSKIGRKDRHTGSDGLRVIALLAVAAYHIRPEYTPGGFLGVVIFLVLAGYYTTRSFIVRPKLDLFSYYKRRISRLWPPLLFLLAVVAVFSGFFLPEVFRFVRESAPSAALGYHNIAEIWADKSYFNRHGSFDPFTHLWALSMELQFYLFFPLIYAALSTLADQLPQKIRLFGREIAGFFLLILGALSALYMGMSYQTGADPTPVYYNSLMRAHAFLNGAAVSLILAGRQMRHAYYYASGRWNLEERKSKPLSPVIRAIFAWPILIALIAAFFYFDESSSFLYQGGYYLYSLLALAFIVLGGVKALPGMGFMETAVFQYLSERSYHIYLWQYTLMIISMAALRFSTLGFWPRLLLHLILLGLAAEVSWRLFDTRSIRGSMKFILTAATSLSLFSLMILPPPTEAKAPSLEGDVVLNAIEENQALQSSLRAHNASQEETETVVKESEKESEVVETEPPHPLAGVELYEGEADEENPLGFSDKAREAFKELNVLVIGDSVMAMAMDGLRQYIPEVYIDAEVSRHFISGPDLIQSLASLGVSGDIWVIALSTNGDIYTETMEIYKEIAQGRPLIFVNTVVPNTWEQGNNQRLADFAAKNENVYIADWYGRAKNVAEYFYQDATHPVPAGALVYDQVILECLWENILSAE